MGENMQKRKWMIHRDPNNKFAGIITLGDRNVEVPQDALISITYGENLNLWRLVLNGILNQFVMSQLRKTEGLLYAELTGQLQGGVGQTMTVWNKKAMPKFRDGGIHRYVMKLFAWVTHSGRVKTYYISYPAHGNIPSAEECTAIIKKYGRFYDGSKLVRKASQPERTNTSA
jgi:hypothetical protein